MRKRKLTPLGVLIKKRLVEVGKTQVDLAREVGTTDKYLNMILYGERSGRKYLSRIARVLGIDPDVLKEHHRVPDVLEEHHKVPG